MPRAAGWRVRDVVAHCIQDHRATYGNFLREWVRSGFSLDTRNQRWVARRRSHSPAELLAEYRATQHLFRALRYEAPFGLYEVVVHGYDIAVPLGRRIETAEQGLIVVADVVHRTRPIVRGRQRGAGLAFRASDLAWSAGQGPEVVGPLASIVMALAGRPAALDNLSGDGLATLRRRVRYDGRDA